MIFSKYNDIHTSSLGDIPLENVLKQLSAKFEGNAVNSHEIHVDNEFAKGVLWGEEPAPGVDIIGWQADMYKPIQVIRTVGGTTPVWSILLSDSPRVQAQQDSSNKSISYLSNRGSIAYLYNHHLTINMLFEGMGPVNMLLMRMKPEIWQHILVNQSPLVKAFIESEEPQFYGLTFNQKLLENFLELIEIKRSATPPNWSPLATSINIITEVFTLFEKRPLQQTIIGLRSQDATRLYKAHSLLLQDYQQPLAIEKICQEVGLGRDKFRKLFLQVYGTTPFQYFQQQRMKEALRLINSGEYSVADVGHLTGYTHMGHFSQAFKKQFGFLPKDIKKHQ